MSVYCFHVDPLGRTSCLTESVWQTGLQILSMTSRGWESTTPSGDFAMYITSIIMMLITILISTQRKSLDSLATSYLKSWLGMPKCGATSAIIYSLAGLNIQSMSHLYFQCQSLSIERTFEKADIRTTQALHSKLRRENTLWEMIWATRGPTSFIRKP